MMEKPEILGANIAGCAIAVNAGFIALSAALKVGGMAAVAAVCNAPAAGTVLVVGFAG